MLSVDKLIVEAEASAAAGHGVLEIMEEILAGLGADSTTFVFMFILHRAFVVPARNLKDLTRWDRLGSGGSLSTAEAVELVRPWLVAAGAKDGTGGDGAGAPD